MNNKERYLYGRSDKLKSREDIKLLFSNGYRFSHFPFRVFCIKNDDEGSLKTAVAVSSKVIKRAVHRNRIKRLMREAYRLQKNPLSAHLSELQKGMTLFILYNGKDIPDYNEVYEHIGKILLRLMKFSNENFKTLA